MTDSDRGGEVTVRWTPSHAGAEGNEKADEFAKEAARGERGAVTDGRLQLEASLAHLRRKTTERKTAATAAWVRDNVGLLAATGHREDGAYAGKISAEPESRQQDATTSCCQATPQSDPTCVTRSTGSRQASTGGARAASVRPSTTWYRSARHGPPRGEGCGRT